MIEQTDEKTSNSPKQRLAIFFMRMLVVFLARTDPASRQAKPACMKRTTEPDAAKKNESKPEVRRSSRAKISGLVITSKL